MTSHSTDMNYSFVSTSTNLDLACRIPSDSFSLALAKPLSLLIFFA